MKRALMIVLAITLLVSVAACGGGEEEATESPAASPDDSPVVELTLDAERTGETLKFSGTTNLPDGALLLYRITLPADADGGSSLEWTGVVNDGRFEGESPPLNWPVELLVAFQMDLDRDGQQPAELIERFGENGEKMKGDTVAYYYEETAGRRAGILVTVE